MNNIMSNELIGAIMFKELSCTITLLFCDDLAH